MRQLIARTLLILAAGLPSTASAAKQEPWVSAQALVDTVGAAVKTRGLLEVGTYADALEASLAGAKDAKARAAEQGIVLTDGPQDTLTALLDPEAGKNAQSGAVSAVSDPYPVTSLYLGSFYNEVGHPEEALRALDAGLALNDRDRTDATAPFLFGERGAALVLLKRFADALANYDNGLSLPTMADHERAMLYRGRGYSLIELGRLDEAEKAYRDSLTYDANNRIALGELEYIAGLRKGKAPGGSAITLPTAED